MHRGGRQHGMKRYGGLAALLFALLLCGGAGGCGDQPVEGVERIVLVTIDTLRADHLGLYGYLRPTSPFLDELASRSVVFERAYSASSHTAPSHASIFSSL